MLGPKPRWLERLFPWPQHELRVNGRSMAYIDEGDRTGRPVLLLSGNPTWGFLYRDFVRPLAEAGYRVIAPDWIGAGYSDHPRVDAGAYVRASYRGSGLADRPAGSARVRDYGPGLGRAAGRGRGAAARRKACGAGAHEHLAFYRSDQQVSCFAEALDHLARAADRAVLHAAGIRCFRSTGPARSRCAA